MVNDKLKLLPELKDNLLYRTCFYDKVGRPIKNIYLDKVALDNLLYKDIYMYDIEIYKLNRDDRELDIFINDADKDFNLNDLFDMGLTFKEINKIMKERK